MNSTFSFDIEDICVAFTDLFSDINKEELQLRAAYFICYDQNPRSSIVAGEEFSSGFYPLSVFLSSAFIFFTITIYVILKDLRKNIFGKLTLGFLSNLFIFYFTAGIVHSLNYFDQKQTFRGTWGCIVFGYIIQHTYVAIFFWTNALQPIFFHYCYKIRTRNTVSFERCQVNLLKSKLSKGCSQ